MQFFGIGLPELMVILFLAVLVIGPERLPSFAADLAQWIRRARAYGQHLTRDFNEVIGDIEKEAGTSREDWKEIASVFNRQTAGVTKELQSVATQLQKAGDIDSTGVKEAASSPSVTEAASSSYATSSNGNAAVPPPIDQPNPLTPDQPDSEAAAKPWYEPEQTASRRRAEPL